MDARTGPLRSQAAADYLNQTIAKWTADRGEPVTVPELARLLSAETGRHVQDYEVRRALHGEVRFENLAYRRAWAQVVPGLDPDRLAALAHEDLTAEPVEVELATPSTRWAVRGIKDRSRPEEWGQILRDAKAALEAERGRDYLASAHELAATLRRPYVKPSDAELVRAAAVSTVALAGGIAAALDELAPRPDGKPHTYHHKQVSRQLDGKVASLDDPALIKAWLKVLPTLDRTSVWLWWLGPLVEDGEGGKIRAIVGNGARTGRRSEQGKRGNPLYPASAGQREKVPA